MSKARSDLSALIDAVEEGRVTHITKEGHCAVLAPLSWLGADHQRLVRALTAVPFTVARAKLGSLVEAAAAGAPQVVTRDGVAVAVLMADVPPVMPRQLTPLSEALATPSRALSFSLASLAPAAQALRGGQLMVVAAPPGAGGSLLVSDAARTTALSPGQAVLYAASGLTSKDVSWRMLAAEAKVNYQALRAGTLPPQQRRAVEEVQQRLQAPSLYIDDGTDLTAEAIAETAPHVDDLALVVVDRFQCLEDPHRPLSGRALPAAARTLSALATRLNVPVLVALDTDDADTVAGLDADVTLLLTREGSDVQVCVSERDFGHLSTLHLVADLSCARFTDPPPPTPLPPSTLSPLAPALAAPAPAPAVPAEESPSPALPAPAAPAKARVPAGASGHLVRGEKAPCTQCGHPTPYRLDGEPRHMKGFCKTVPAQVPATPGAEGPASGPVPEQAEAGQPTTHQVGAWPAGIAAPASRPAAEPVDEHVLDGGLIELDPAQTQEESDRDEREEEGDEERPAGKFDFGPFAVLDGNGTAYLASGKTRRCPATTIRELVTWAADREFGTPRLSEHGRDGDPLIVVMPEAGERLGLPPSFDPATRALPPDHPLLADLAEHGWETPQRGPKDAKRPWLSDWPRIFQRVERGRRSVQLAIVGWGALSRSGWPLPLDEKTNLPTSTAREVAAFLAAYCRRIHTPVSTTAATGQELMTALRPPTRAWRDQETGEVRSAWVKDSWHRAVTPAPPEVPHEHPLARGRDHLDPAQTLMEEALSNWWRMPTEQERRLPYIVALDINVAFGAASNGTVIGTCAPYFLEHAPFNPKIPGCWLYDLSGVPVDERLPSPFTPTGKHPTGPAWYETHTIELAVELGFVPGPTKAYLRPNDRQAKALGIAPHPVAEGDKNPPPPFGNGPYLRPWYEHLNRGYLETMAALGVTPKMEPHDFLAAMARLDDEAFRAEHATDLMVLSAIKATFKGAIGKLRERPHETNRRSGDPHAPWEALKRATWRPDARAAVIARSRATMNRKIHNTLAATGAAPLAVLTDCILFASPEPDILWLCDHKGGFSLGVNPGHVKQEGIQPMDWYLELAGKNLNPARFIKSGHDKVLDGGE
ncbi:DnaB-like helicase C-terminal domain-containing protein [Streptomyces sp. NPDC020883]|uniref:DnaB-like helicase C-terminal domain-containing protein n=1 Tax=Streptomyces sp. NPDC020883 TaxID=3365099 RepID=UPI0037A3B0AD